MDRWIKGNKNGWMDGYENGCKDELIKVWMDGGVADVWMGMRGSTPHAKRCQTGCGMAWHSMGSAQHGSAQHGVSTAWGQHSMGSAQHGSAQHGFSTAWVSTVWVSTAWVQHSMGQHSMGSAQHGVSTAWRQHSAAWYCMASVDKARNSAHALHGAPTPCQIRQVPIPTTTPASEARQPASRTCRTSARSNRGAAGGCPSAAAHALPPGCHRAT
eukprot:352456-Chlamydomonas_euryale.AAC.1